MGTARWAIRAVLCKSLVCLLLCDAFYMNLRVPPIKLCTWLGTQESLLLYKYSYSGGDFWRCSGPRREQLFVAGGLGVIAQGLAGSSTLASGVGYN